MLTYSDNVSVAGVAQDYLHPIRNGLLLLAAAVVFLACGIFGRRFREFGFRLPDNWWATRPSRIVFLIFALSFLLGAIDQLWHVH